MRMGSRPHHPHRLRGDPLSEQDERLAVQGPQGEQGERGKQGEQGTAGLSTAVRRAVLFLFALSMILTIGDLFWNAHQVNTSRAANHRQSVATERKICTEVNGLASLKPPAGNPADNPSRAYLQGLHVRFTEISRDLGCK
jgi:hypothetical protein